MSAQEDITFRAVRANWPVLIAVVMGIAWAVRGEMTIQQNSVRLDRMDELISVEGISRYAADMALLKHRLDRVEVSCTTGR